MDDNGKLGLVAMATELGVLPGWLRSKADDGTIPADMEGRRFVFDREEVWERVYQMSGWGPNGYSCVKLLSASEMAPRLGLGRDELVRLAEEGRIPCFKTGDRYVFNPCVVAHLEFLRAVERRSPKNYRHWTGRSTPRVDAEGQ